MPSQNGISLDMVISLTFILNAMGVNPYPLSTIDMSQLDNYSSSCTKRTLFAPLALDLFIP
jgi:hypothetical protein